MNSFQDRSYGYRTAIFSLTGLFLFLPQILTEFVFKGVYYFAGPHAVFSAIASCVTLLLISRHNNSKAASAFLASAFVFSAIADSIFMITALNPLREAMWVVSISEASYTVFMTLFAAFVFLHYREVVSQKSSALFVSIVFAIFVYVNYEYILHPFFTRDPRPSHFHIVNSTLYAAIESLCMALLTPIILRTNSRTTFVLASLFFALFVGDFGIRYQTVLMQQSSLLGFEYIWETVMAGFAVLFFFTKRLPNNSPESFSSYYSLRVVGVGAQIAAIFGLLALLIASKLMVVSNALLMTNILLAVLFVFIFANYAAMVVSRQLKSASAEPFHELSRAVTVDEYHNPLTPLPVHPRLLSEVREIKQEFNRFVDHLNRVISYARSQSEQAAIARTTQMLAHDVRKPFSMLKMTLDLLSVPRSPEDQQKIIKTATSDVQRAMASVNGLIQDVMEIDSKSELLREPAQADSLVFTTLADTFRIHHKSDVQIEYKLNHSRDLMVDTARISRVFLNIFGNAIQAISNSGKIWVHTRDITTPRGEKFVEFALGNNGPHIEQEDLGRLFDAFFTKNKKGGTGLGLAIAQKVVKAHGGNIWCESAHNRGVEFKFTLPTAEGASAQTLTLPDHARGFATTLISHVSSSSVGDELAFQEVVVQELQKRGKPFHVLVLDDEALYRNAISAHLSGSAELSSLVKIVATKNSREAILHIENCVQKSDFPNLMVLDVDLGPGSPSGFETLRAIREKGVNTLACIHTNRVLLTDNKTAFDCGADVFLPKPATRAHLLKLVIQALEKEGALVSKPAGENVKAPPPKSHRIAVVDDDAIVLMSWEMAFASGEILCFSSPEAFWDAAKIDDNLIASLSGVVTDLHFDNESATDGLGFAEALAQHASVPVFLCTNATQSEIPASAHVKRVVPKDVEQAKEIVLASLKRA
jgi:signal transduction histidine kinase/DNA-binding NarL/FixJ family response regulator